MEIKFKRDTSFRKQFFVPDSFAHPAKMDAHLLIWIVEKYSKVGETILDPMDGSGTTMLACGLGRDVILVELEEKFCKMMQDNWGEVRMRPQLGYQMGSCEIIQGDARQLENILCDRIITSPPYAESQVPPHTAEGEARRLEIAKERGVSPDKVSYLDYTKKDKGLVDKIVTSPPYAEALDRDEYKHLGGSVADMQSRSYLKSSHGKAEGQIGNLPYGQIDKIVTSPPYEEAMGKKHHSPRADKLAQEKSNPVTYTNRVDSIITSPPYEQQIHPTHETIEKVRATNDPKHLGEHSQAMLVDGYGGAAGNIGNLKSDSYLEAMLQVYQQCHKVLRSQGLMILVTKNFIRNKQVVRLDTDTIKLCEQAGFSFVERHNRKLPSQSFWRVIYHQKHPEVEQIKFEDVLVFRRYVS